MHLYGEGVVLRAEAKGAVISNSSESGFAASVQFYPETSESFLSNLEDSGPSF
jgi:hypothetical protein